MITNKIFKQIKPLDAFTNREKEILLDSLHTYMHDEKKDNSDRDISEYLYKAISTSLNS